MKNKENTNRLCQMATGEGKSLTIALVATYYGMTYLKPIDIITSDPDLASRDSNRFRSLYELFNLKCADNKDRKKYVQGEKECYKCNIVYGEVSQFEFDHLNHNFLDLKTLGKREKFLAIVDEVDNMLIDEKSKSAKLSSPIPGMSKLDNLYVIIWKKLCLLRDDYEEDLKKILMKNNAKIEKIGEIEKIQHEHIELIRLKLEKFALGVVEKNKFDEKNDTVPAKEDLIEMMPTPLIKTHYKKFVEQRVKSAINAMFYMEKDRDYIINNLEKIVPIDFENTGQLQESTNWSNGLHQFLEIKHDLEITSENLTTNFISNVYFFKLYKKIIGLSGTLGSKKSQKILSNIYQTDVIDIPETFQKIFMQYETLISSDFLNWADNITNSALFESKKGRGVLIITLTILEAIFLRQSFEGKISPHKIKLYIYNGQSQAKNIEKINPEEIIIATNLAGRGTDISTEKIDSNGGLHVILSYLPKSKRVQDQAFGRTSRQGRPGSGQMIILPDSVLSNADTCDLEELRDELEVKELQCFIENELDYIITKAEKFEEFCDFRKELKSSKLIDSDEIKAQYILMSIEEEWAIFLQTVDEKDFEKKFYDFMKKLKKESLEKLCSPYYYIEIGSYYKQKDKWSKAEENFDFAIKNFQNFETAGAYHGKFFACIKNEKACNLNPNFDSKKLEMLELLKIIIRIAVKDLELIKYVLGMTMGLEKNNRLSEQFNNKLNIMQKFIQGVQNNYSAIESSIRYFDIEELDENHRLFYSNNIKGSSEFEKISKHLLKEKKILSVSFKNLSCFTDIFSEDQAIKLINSDKIDADEKKFAVEMVSISCEDIRSLIFSSLNYDEVTWSFLETQITQSKSPFRKANKNNWDNKEIFITNKSKKSSTKFLAKNFAQLVKNENPGDIIDCRIFDGNPEGKKFRSLLEQDRAIPTLEIPDIDEEVFNQIKNIIDMNTIFDLKYDNLKFEMKSFQALDFDCLVEIYSNCNNQTKILVQNLKDKKDKNAWKSAIGIKFTTINKENLEEILEIIKKESNSKRSESLQSFSISIPNVKEDFLNLLKCIVSNPIQLHIHNLSKSSAKAVIEHIREKNFNFTLKIEKMKSRELLDLLSGNYLESEKLIIPKQKTIENEFPKDFRPINELINFQLMGITHIYVCNEDKMMPWKSMTLLGSLAAVQIIGGIFFLEVGFANVGKGLIEEGAIDIFALYDTYTSREFNVKMYLGGKVAGLCMAVAIYNIKNSRRVKQLLSSSEELAVSVRNNSKTSNILITKGAKVASSQFVTRGLNYISNLALEKHKDYIAATIQKRVAGVFQSHSIRPFLFGHKLIDLIFKKKEDEKLRDFKKIVHKAIHSEGISVYLDTFLQKISSEIVRQASSINSNLAILTIIGNFLYGANELNKIIEVTQDKMIEFLNFDYEKNYSLEVLLKKRNPNLVLYSEDIKKMKNFVNTKYPYTEGLSYYSNKDPEPNFVIENPEGSLGNNHEFISEFLRSVYITELSIENYSNDIGEIISEITDVLTDRVVKIITEKMIKPSTSYIGSLVGNKIEEYVDNHLQKSDSKSEETQKNFQVPESKSNKTNLQETETNIQNQEVPNESAINLGIWKSAVLSIITKKVFFYAQDYLVEKTKKCFLTLSKAKKIVRYHLFYCFAFLLCLLMFGNMSYWDAKEYFFILSVLAIFAVYVITKFKRLCAVLQDIEVEITIFYYSNMMIDKFYKIMTNTVGERYAKIKQALISPRIERAIEVFSLKTAKIRTKIHNWIDSTPISKKIRNFSQEIILFKNDIIQTRKSKQRATSKLNKNCKAVNKGVRIMESLDELLPLIVILLFLTFVIMMLILSFIKVPLLIYVVFKVWRNPDLWELLKESKMIYDNQGYLDSKNYWRAIYEAFEDYIQKSEDENAVHLVDSPSKEKILKYMKYIKYIKYAHSMIPYVKVLKATIMLFNRICQLRVAAGKSEYKKIITLAKDILEALKNLIKNQIVLKLLNTLLPFIDIALDLLG